MEKNIIQILRAEQIDMCLVESKASGDPLIQDLYKGGITSV